MRQDDDGILQRRKYAPYELKLVKNNLPIKRGVRSKTQAKEGLENAKTERALKKNLKELELSKGSVNFTKSGKRQRKAPKR